MTYNEIIEIIYQDANSIAIANKDIYPSKILGMCLCRYKHNYVTDDDIKINKNPLGQKNPSTLKKLSFESLYEGLSNSIYDEFINSTINQEELNQIIKAWNLVTYDLTYIKNTDLIIIDLSEEDKIPFIDQYTIYKNNEIILVTSSKEEAENMAIKNNDYIVKNSRGKVINFNPKIESKNADIKTISIKAGAKIVCTNINVYKSYDSAAPMRVLNGIYYILDGKNYNGMYEVCQKTIIKNDENIIPVGFVRESDLIK